MLYKRFYLFSFMLFLILFLSLFSVVPQKVSFQGVLTDNGKLINGNINFDFTLLEMPGSVAVYNTNALILVTDGIYDIDLAIPANNFNPNFTYELQVDANTTNIPPNIQIVTVPYSYYADEALGVEWTNVNNRPAGLDGGAIWDTNGTATYYNSGNVGIGTNNPADRLSNLGAANQVIYVESTLNYSHSGITLKTANAGMDYFEIHKFGATASGTTMGVSLAGLSYLSAGAQANGMMFKVTTANSMYFGTGNTERMRIAAAGNVIIDPTGTIDYATDAGDLYVKDALDVDGDIYVSGTLTGDGIGLSNIPGLWNKSGTILYYNSGRVGIGTAFSGGSIGRRMRKLQ